MSGVAEILEKAGKATVIAEMHGVKVASFEDAVALATLDQKNDVKLTPPEMNPDGTVAGTPTTYAAVNPEMFFDNRYRVVETDDGTEYQVVVAMKGQNYLYIRGQKEGRVPHKIVPVDVILNDKGKPKYKTMVTVSDTEFIADFTHIFTREDMAKILPVVMKGAEETVAEKSIFK